MADEFLTISELAGRLDIHERQLVCYVKAGTIPYRKIGKELRFRWRHIEAWLATLPGSDTITKHPETLPATHQRSSRVQSSPQETPEPVIALVRGPKGQHRARLKQARGEM